MYTRRLIRSIQKIQPQLTPSENRIARYILENESRIALETGASLATATKVSEITVSRFLKRLGFKGMRALKDELKKGHVAGVIPTSERYARLLSTSQMELLEAESAAILKLTSQLARPEWNEMIEVITDADCIFISGFQTVEGISRDFSRRLSIVHDSVNFVSANQSGLVEWIKFTSTPDEARAVLILIDIMPYAREGIRVCQLARKSGFDIIVLSDEFNNLFYEYTRFVFHATSKTGFFLETTATLSALMNFIIHAVAEQNPETARERVESYLEVMRGLELY